MVTKLINWAGNYTYSTPNLHYPETLAQLQTLTASFKKLKVLGTRHSFNSIADSTENLISLERYEPVMRIDAEHRQVSIAASVRYGELGQILHQAGWALHNLASLPHIAVVGACTTATHGSGYHNQNLAAAVSGLEFVTADGDLVRLSRERDGHVLAGAVVGLGGLGVVVGLTLDLLPTFEVRQDVYEYLPIQQLEDHFDAIMASAYSVSLFTNWQSDFINQVWLKQRRGDPNIIPGQSEFFGATPAKRQMHPIAELSAEASTPQNGLYGPWHERLPHFRFDATPSVGNELQSEYFVPRHFATAALRAVSSLRNEFAQHLLISEIRSIAADNFWMSPCYHQDSIAIHFTWKPNWPAVSQILPLIEAKLAPFDARPHWGKLFTMPAQRLQSLYEKLPQFQNLLRHYDPHGKFRNTFLDTMLF